MYKILTCMLIALLTYSLSSCSYFQVRKPIIEQGNIITDEAVSQLHPGMSFDEVRNIMGTPVLINTFTPNRVAYIYTYKERSNPLVVKRLVCLFDNSGYLRTIER